MDDQPRSLDSQLSGEPVRLRVGANSKPGRGDPVEARWWCRGANVVPDAHDPSVRHAPMMFTTDLALKVDPAYRADHVPLAQ